MSTGLTRINPKTVNKQTAIRPMTFTDFAPTIKGAAIATVGWLIASVKSFGILFQVAAPRVEMYDAWVSLAIKIVTLITGIVLFYYNINKIIKQRNAMRPDGGGDNESGRGSDIEPREEEDDDK